MSNIHFDHLFGPVPSRRLGISLGIDLVPYKTCSLNCVYCECGATTDLTLERKEYAPTNAVISELKQFLSTSPKLDYITFSGAGEPTLHSGIGQIVEFLKNDFPHYKTALLTNGTLFYQQILINEVKKIDLILPSLDAASDPVFRKIDRPVKGLGIQNIITGLVNLRSEFPGTIWLEIFIVPGVNDSEEEIKLLREAIHRIRPDQVQLNTLDRPGTESWVKAATKIKLENIAQHLDWETDIIANFQKREHIASYNLEIEDAIIQTLKRRPCTSYDLSAVLGSHPNEINKYLDSLLKHKRIRSEEMERGRFYKISDDI